MDGFRRHVDALAGAELDLLEPVAAVDLVQQLARPHHHRFVLAVVVLQAEGVALVDVQDLADVAFGLRPVQLVAPGLLDARDLTHDSAIVSASMRRMTPSTVSTSRARMASRAARRAAPHEMR